uniref:protein jagged-1-like n=1 Tax=Styela clava TaxID=7725 RepID=UPI0019394BE8|nr:protein jagged-1-like [Styela clava]
MRRKDWGNEPNGGTNENCLMKYAGASYKWIDGRCSTEAGYICQKSVSSGNCGSDVCLKKGSCKIENPRYTCTCNAGYFGTKCEKDLITISATPTTRSVNRGESIDVQLNIESYDGNANVDVRNQNDVKIKTVTTSVISSSNPSTTLTINIEVPLATISYKFEAGPQSNNSSYSRIVTLTLVVNDACDSSPCKNGAICQYTTAAPYYNCTCRPEYNGTTCEEPTYNLYKNCKYHVNFYKKKTFGESNTTCNSLGGAVAMMKTDAIQDFVESQIIDQYGEGSTISFWIGAYKPNTDWLWVDDTPITNSKWLWSSISQGNGYLFKSSYSTTRDNMKWINNDGSNTLGYVCEIPSFDKSFSSSSVIVLNDTNLSLTYSRCQDSSSTFAEI